MSGDHGGNDEIFPSIEGVKNLHGVWDSIGYNYTKYPKLPLSKEDWIWYSEQSRFMEDNYPIPPIDDSPDFQVWATESYELARTIVYPGK